MSVILDRQLYKKQVKPMNYKNREIIMSTTNNDSSDIKQAAENADSKQIAQNLKSDKKVDTPESLSEEEKTSFIEDELRTDK